jgi:hypothetical protein
MLGVGVFAVTLVITAGPLIGQKSGETTAIPKQPPVSVPFVGCRSDGQTGPLKAPSGKNPVLPIGRALAQRLAYYSSAEGFGVLAPRGWNCFGTYGSGGQHVYVSPEPIDVKMLFSDKWDGFLGAAVQLDYRYGGTSGRFAVAEIIARVFPEYKAFAIGVMKELTPPDRFSFGPYPNDALTYKGKTVLEYSTPPHADGLGTRSSLKKNDSPVEGAVMLVERTPDLMQLSVRLPRDMAELSATIIRQVEREAERLPQPGVR